MAAIDFKATLVVRARTKPEASTIGRLKDVALIIRNDPDSGITRLRP
jgi:hypothetical protein